MCSEILPNQQTYTNEHATTHSHSAMGVGPVSERTLNSAHTWFIKVHSKNIQPNICEIVCTNTYMRIWPIRKCKYFDGFTVSHLFLFFYDRNRNVWILYFISPHTHLSYWNYSCSTTILAYWLTSVHPVFDVVIKSTILSWFAVTHLVNWNLNRNGTTGYTIFASMAKPIKAFIERNSYAYVRLLHYYKW